MGKWQRDDWSWILGLLEHNGAHLKALHLHVSLRMIGLTVKFLRVHLGPDHHCLGEFPSRLWQVCPGLSGYWRPNPR